ncbi:MAG: hypothetical protein H6721_14595 [Sandaracinus sp.]|nr:hypothetical protein [Sandaracinus sp.]
MPRDGYAGTYDWNGRVGWGNERGGVSAFVGFHRSTGPTSTPQRGVERAAELDVGRGPAGARCACAARTSDFARSTRSATT